MPLIINDDEKKVIREMRDRNIKQLTIHFSDGEKRIESTKTGIMSKEQTQMIKEVLGLKNYERITIDTIDEKTLSFKKTRKKV